MSIRTKLILIFLAFTIIPMSFLGTLVFYKTRQVLRDVRILQIEKIADLKRDKIETFFSERNADIIAAQNFYNIKRNLPLLESSNRSGRREAFQALDNQIKPFQKASGYLNIMLTNAVGQVVYASDEGHRGDLDKAVLNPADFEQGRKGIYFTDILVHAAGPARFEIFGLGPVQDFKGNFIGEVIFEIDMGPVYRFIQDTTGLGKTGETVIVRREGSEVFYLSPLRGEPDSIEKKAFFNGKWDAPSKMAAEGKSGAGIAVDHRGVNVLSAWRYIPSLRWGLVVKMTMAEAFEPISYLRKIAFAIGFFIVAAGIIAALLMAKSLFDPIFALQRGAGIIGGGNLEYRVGTSSEDEIGQLSRAFDRMTEALAAKNAELSQKARELESSNQELALANARLEAANEDLESFSFSASHDLRSPLISIGGFTRILEEDYSGQLDDEGKRLLKIVRENARKMEHLIEDILAFSRVSTKGLRAFEINMEALAAGVVEELGREMDLSGIEIEAGPLPPAQGDLAMIRQVLVNLISNSLKYAAAERMCKIEIGGRRSGDENLYFVKDNGIGFEMRQAEKIFGLFHRLHKDRIYKGTGVGLAIVKRIVEKHGGRIWAEAREGEGATFYFSLPRGNG